MDSSGTLVLVFLFFFELFDQFLFFFCQLLNLAIHLVDLLFKIVPILKSDFFNMFYFLLIFLDTMLVFLF